MKFLILLCTVLSEISGWFLKFSMMRFLIFYSANYIAKSYSPMSAGDKIKIPNRFIKRFVPGGFDFTEMHNAIENFHDKARFNSSLRILVQF